MHRAAVLVVLFAAGCAGTSASSSEPSAPAAAPLPDRDPALAKRLVEHEGGILLDVRTADEFAEGHLEGAVNVSHDEIEARLAEIEALTGGDPSTPIVTYCRSGNRAGQARATLEAAGYTRVTNIGGMADYPAP